MKTLTIQNKLEIKIENCRACSSSDLTYILDLGNQPLSGVFPLSNESDPMSGPLKLLKCDECHLVQLDHDFPLDLMYGDNYGYRSGLNASMASHLSSKAQRLINKYKINPGSTILDIGSNDGTLLNSYDSHQYNLVGIDPTIKKFGEFYNEGILKIADFFDASLYLRNANKAQLITSISMLYDLQDPFKFIQDIANILDKDGIWHFEQSYLPSMMQTNAYDTVCHEHLEYYSINSINRMLIRANLRIVDIEFNSTNGGSFAVTAARGDSAHVPHPLVSWHIRQEDLLGLDQLQIYEQFRQSVSRHITSLVDFFRMTKHHGMKVYGIGASTKGNVLLNSAKIDSSYISAIIDVNEYKWERVTPGSRIPIYSEELFEKFPPDLAFVLPWHFKPNINFKYKDYLIGGGKMVYPLPYFEVVGD